MSGGSYDYSYQKVLEMADQLAHSPSPLRRAFSVHLKKVAVAMHDIEWVDSCDYGKGDENPAIKACLEDDLEALTKEALDTMFYEFHQRLATDYKALTGNDWRP